MNSPVSQDASRRDFLRNSAAGLGSFAVAGGFGRFLAQSRAAGQRVESGGYGELQPVKDKTTGLPLLQLPQGFTYASFGWTKDLMDDGVPTPADHDGMAVISEQEDVLTLCRNHELTAAQKPFGFPETTFDPQAGGGCTNLTFNRKSGTWGKAWSTLSGTVKNCAGGPTLWGSWLSCEEAVAGPNWNKKDTPAPTNTHGWIFEVPAEGTATAKPLTDMGRFKHEAVALDPDTGIVYETEDQHEAGFYRFHPHEPGQLHKGGKLEMLRVAGTGDLRQGSKMGQTYDADWVPINDPYRAHHFTNIKDEHGVYMQGKFQGAATFARLEGAWYGNDAIYITATTGGKAGKGQVWQYLPKQSQLKLVFESPNAKTLDMPDNITVSPRGGVIVCEDGGHLPQRMFGLTPAGSLFHLASNNVVLKGERNEIKGDFRKQEWAGVCFDSTGKWLFVNIQTPGITFAITGPWEDGLL